MSESKDPLGKGRAPGLVMILKVPFQSPTLEPRVHKPSYIRGERTKEVGETHEILDEMTEGDWADDHCERCGRRWMDHGEQCR